MNKEEVIEIVNTFLVEEFEVEQEVISPKAPLKDTLGLDSLDYVDLVVIIESNFGVKLTETDFVNIDSFDDFYNMINNKIKAKA